MLKVGLVGLGFMGRMHLDKYVRLNQEGYPVKLVSICDISSSFDKSIQNKGNIAGAAECIEFDKYSIYDDVDKMLENEDLDFIDITLPTFLHKDICIKALNKGLHVLCEKPMALSVVECQEMIQCAKINNKKLMIAHCLRFWPEYQFLYEMVRTQIYGKPMFGFFYRGGSTPFWSYDNWLLTEEKSGGCILDQHIHDIDVINWIFGLPDKVSTIGLNKYPGSGFDMVSTNYIYNKANIIINAQDDWTLNGDYGFKMQYRVSFERGNIVFESGVLTVNPDNSKSFTPDLPKDDGYYNEIKYFIEKLIKNEAFDVVTPESAMNTIKIAQAEIQSARGKGILVDIDKNDL